MRVIITEKPSVANDIAKVLGITTKKNGYYEDNNTVITWAFGHLVTLIDPDQYDDKYKSWMLNDLPILPIEFQKKVVENDGASRQFETIKQCLLHKDVTDVVCATDAGREGELIFRFIYEHAGCQVPIQRLWISSQTDQAIKEGFANLKPGADYEALFDSAVCRSEADWLIGMNATRAYTIKFSRGAGVMSVGRVQTPVLKMICDRYDAYSSFKPETFYELFATINHENGTFKAKWFCKKDDRLFDKSKAETLLESLQKQSTGTILSLTEKEKKEQPPLLYDLTELQKDANKKFKFSADNTLKIMQDLYERHKVLTYPRTSSRYLTKDMEPKLKELIENVGKIDAYKPFADTLLEAPKIITSKRIIDDKKVTDHHAIIPTDKQANLSQMSDEERKIFDLVMKRFLSVFMPLCLKDFTEIIVGIDDQTFKTTGTVMKQPGWRGVYGVEDEKDADPLLPIVQKDDAIIPAKIDLNTGKTKAPPLHTEASILSAMETAGKTIEDEDLKEAIKDCGLGTPATRASILERLIQVNYIVREKNRLSPTEKGHYLIANIHDDALVSAELTGNWEKKLNDMAQNNYKREDYMEEIKEFASSIVDDVKAAESPGVSPDQKVLADCPLCEKGKIIDTPKSFGCSNWKSENCTFAIWKQIAGKPITEKIALTLLADGKTEEITGFKSRAGKDFNAKLKLVEGKVAFDFTDKTFGKCPVCKEGEVAETAKAYSCSNWKETNCKFVIWKLIAQKAITEKDLKALLEKGITEEIKGFKSRAGKDFSAALELKDGKATFKFSS